MTNAATFDAALVTITRKRFSVTQGEVLIEYNGQRIEQYGDTIRLVGKDWVGHDDAFWHGVAKREAIARGLAVAELVAFEPGKTYWTRSIVDADCKVRVTVAKRTAKFITTTEGKRLGVSVFDGVEQVKPWGSYSMCPIVGADKVEVAA